MSLPWNDDYIPPSADNDLIAATQSVGGTVPAPAPPPLAAPAAPPAPAGGSWLDAVQAAVKASTQEAVTAALPAIQARVAQQATEALQGVGERLGLPAEAPVPHIDTKDLTKVDAWERAARTFFVGLMVTILGAIVQVVGQISTTGTSVDWFHKEGWMAVGVLFIGAIVNAASSYVLRLVKEPVGAKIDSSKSG